MKTSINLVECPTVNTWHGLPSLFDDATVDALIGVAGGRTARRRGALGGVGGLGASAADELADALLQHGQEFIVEPGVGLEPRHVAR